MSQWWLGYLRDFGVMQGKTQQAYCVGKTDSCLFKYSIVNIFSDTTHPVELAWLSLPHKLTNSQIHRGSC